MEKRIGYSQEAGRRRAYVRLSWTRGVLVCLRYGPEYRGLWLGESLEQRDRSVLLYKDADEVWESYLRIGRVVRSTLLVPYRARQRYRYSRNRRYAHEQVKWGVRRVGRVLVRRVNTRMAKRRVGFLRDLTVYDEDPRRIYQPSVGTLRSRSRRYYVGSRSRLRVPRRWGQGQDVSKADDVRSHRRRYRVRVLLPIRVSSYVRFEDGTVALRWRLGWRRRYKRVRKGRVRKEEVRRKLK